VELMKEMRDRIIICWLDDRDCVMVSTKNTQIMRKLYMHRQLYSNIGIHNPNHTTSYLIGYFPIHYIELAKLPANYWYSNGGT